MSRPRNPERKVATAYHEAGHAVAAYRLDIPVTRATIEADDDSLGSVVHANLHRRVYRALEAGPITPQTRDKIERHMIIALAGGIAEKQYCNRGNYVGSKRDRHSVVDFAIALSNSTAEAEAYLKWLQQRTINLIQRNWNAVDAVTERLLALTTLSGDEVATVIRESDERRFQQHLSERGINQ